MTMTSSGLLTMLLMLLLMMSFVLFIFTPALLQAKVTGDDVHVLIEHLGKLRGKRRFGPVVPGEPGTRTDDLFPLVDWYLGVPYASPPTSNLRFQKTDPPQPWSGTRDAVKFQPSCPQRFHPFRFEDEDCLYLNIYAPVKPENDSSSPVMMYIHGGSYLEGSGSLFIGDALAQHGVVVVTINYRLGILGNWGLYDQIEALKWIQSNIKYFGGDPSSVTVFGNSAGGASVGILAASPVTKGLLRRAIMQSGSPLSFWAVHSNVTVDYEGYVRNIARRCGCDQNNLEEAVRCLRRVDLKKLDIRVLQGEGLETLKPTNHDLLPIVDDVIIPGDFFHSPVKFHVESFMSGVAANEWSRHIFLYFELYADEFGLTDSAMEDLCCDLDMEGFRQNVEYVTKKLHRLGDLAADLIIYRYTNFSALDDLNEIRQQYMNFAADMAFVIPTLNYAVSAATPNGDRDVATYFYVFNHKRSSDQYKSWQQNYHEIELTYIFGHPFRGDDPYSDVPVEYTQHDKEVCLHVMRLWTNFAKEGDPNGKKRESDAWKSFDSSKLNYYLIDLPGNSSMKSHLRSEYVKFWNDIVPKLNQNRRHDEPKPRCLNVILLSIAISTLAVLLLGSIILIGLKRYKRTDISDNKNEPSVIYKKNSQS